MLKTVTIVKKTYHIHIKMWKCPQMQQINQTVCNLLGFGITHFPPSFSWIGNRYPKMDQSI